MARTKIKRKCSICGQVFEICPCMLKHGRGKFCSRKCYYLSKKGKPRYDLRGREAWNKGKSFQQGANHPMWKGGVRKTKHGYYLVYVPNHPSKPAYGNYIRRSRYVMEQLLGRTLKAEEVVHHINGIKDDDRIENLQWLPSQSVHRKLHYLQRKLKIGA